MFEVAELGRKLDKKSFAAKEPQVREALLEAQARLAESDVSLVIVIAGVEGSGKGDTVNLLLEWMDARGITAYALGLPTPEETERPFFYRFWRRLPPKGRTAIFFGSWYTGPIVEHVTGGTDDADLERQLRRIVEFERMLVDEGTLLLKFWMYLTKKQQRKRFEKLEADPDNAWRVTPADWEFYETHDSFVETSAHTIRRTNTAHAPWHIVEANDSRYRNMTVAEHVLSALEKRLDAPPPPPWEPETLPTPAKLDVLSALDLTQKLSRDEYEQRLKRQQAQLGRLARRMTGANRSAVVMFEGPDAAGKGGCIRRIVHALDARFYNVIQIAAPTEEERARPYLWRFWRNLPRRGHFAIFDSSWYGRGLVERLEGLASPDDWRRAYAEINAFEEQLVDASVLVFKFWLAIDEQEQLRRFEERKATGYKRYKLTDEDWRNREKWPAYHAATAEMIEKTSTEIAPWTLVEANDKRHARVKVLDTLCEALEKACGADESPHPSTQKKKRKKRKKRKK